jgi:hypothetical protein
MCAQSGRVNHLYGGFGNLPVFRIQTHGFRGTLRHQLLQKDINVVWVWKQNDRPVLGASVSLTNHAKFGGCYFFWWGLVLLLKRPCWWVAAALSFGTVQAVARVAGPNGPVCTCAGCEPDVVDGIAEIAARVQAQETLAGAEVAAAIKSALTKFDALDT